ncbi:Photosystem II 5 kDa protein, chloroplastic [Apostasia shenzhenica]|uniref:Photosystem II 5 kDa protein, chloroplastic n=1 Tax=Apostasia shenzhenica TaxID=1088818 RepID=A0A2I0BDS0_9ASPA|nr:Photosystem II 5 kDa protein, chloroplastic [Apostasia shenzhenica]
MTATFLAAASPLPATRRKLVAVKAAAAGLPAAVAGAGEVERSGRRNAMLAVAASAICAVGSAPGIAAAVEEPKPGSPEAKKKYAPVCVTMPTARICHN